MSVQLNTEHVRHLLRKKFAQPEWALFEEVPPATGGGIRYADAVAMNLWKSRGYSVLGFEIKVSRGDWLRELKNPLKTEAIIKYCNQWWIVALKDVVKDGELPPTWGLFEVTEKSIQQVVKAPPLTPEPFTKEFFASLVRRSHEQINKLASERYKSHLLDARAEIDQRVEQEVQRKTARYLNLQSKVDEFEKKTGLQINEYMAPIGVIQLAQKLEKLRGFDDAPFSKLTRLATELNAASSMIQEAVNNSLPSELVGS